MTQSSYEALLSVDIDDTTGAKTLTVDPAPGADNLTGILKVAIDLDTEEWFEITDSDVAAGTFTTGLRGLSNTLSTLTEVAGNRAAHYIGEKVALVTFQNEIHTQNTDTGTTSSTFTIDSANDYAKLDTAGLTADRTYTFPDGDDELGGIAATQTLTNKTLTTPTITSPVINTQVSGTAIQTTLGSPGSDTLIASEKAIRTAITGGVAGVADIDGETGTIQLVGGTDISITNSPAGTFTFDSSYAPETADAVLTQQVFS